MFPTTPLFLALSVLVVQLSPSPLFAHGEELPAFILSSALACPPAPIRFVPYSLALAILQARPVKDLGVR